MEEKPFEFKQVYSKRSKAGLIDCVIPEKPRGFSGCTRRGMVSFVSACESCDKKRLVVLLVFVIIVFLLLLIRIGYWTFYKGEWLQSQAEGQWTQDTSVAAQRGSIFDRNGNVLAQSASADTVLLSPQRITEPEKVADSLASILEMDRSVIYEKATDTSKYEYGSNGRSRATSPTRYAR